MLDNYHKLEAMQAARIDLNLGLQDLLTDWTRLWRRTLDMKTAETTEIARSLGAEQLASVSRRKSCKPAGILRWSKEKLRGVIGPRKRQAKQNRLKIVASLEKSSLRFSCLLRVVE